ncbi:MAG: molybdopterin-dependent oxidoreductase [Gammaproteobacteria bacterium]|nr:molybdopterin-dependent oxidoreductase [Gammaproteobacteria bacterium]
MISRKPPQGAKAAPISRTCVAAGDAAARRAVLAAGGINAISGNLDRAGGMLMGQGIVDMAREVKRAGEVTLRHDRDDGLPSVVGLQPSGMLAPDIEQGRVKGMIVEASNPLLACSNPGGRLDRAFAGLELLVCIDLFRNEVGSLAHYVLPAPTWLERAEIPYALQSFMACTPVPYMVYSEAVLEPPPEVRHEWWIYSRLAEACGVTMFGKRWLAALLRLNTRLVHARRRSAQDRADAGEDDRRHAEEGRSAWCCCNGARAPSRHPDAGESRRQLPRHGACAHRRRVGGSGAGAVR